jgi:Golgi phosphoprotein 3
MTPPLNLVEELELLSLDDKTGAHLPLMPEALGYGLAGAILADLEMAGRLSTAGKIVELKSSAPTGNSLLDPWLERIAADSKNHAIAYWLSVFSDEKPAIETAVLDQLIARTILKREDKKILWVFGLRRYPTVHNEERVEVRTRLARLIQGEETPPHFDATLISLLSGCNLLPAVFHNGELEKRSDRIEAISSADPVGREVAAASREMIDALMMAQSASTTPF